MSETMTPSGIVSGLDRRIIGQHKAKEAVVVTLCDRWHRQQVEDPLRQEIAPKSVLTIGPIGMDKIEIAHRLAKLTGTPFIRIEATKFTGAGYVDRDVDTIIRDLAKMTAKQTRESEMKKAHTKAEDAAEDHALDMLIPPPHDIDFTQPGEKGSAVCQALRKELRGDRLGDKEVELEMSADAPNTNIAGPPDIKDIIEQTRSMFVDLD